MSEPTTDKSTVDDLPAAARDVASASASAPDSGPPIPATASVLDALGAHVPPVQLREPDSDAAAPPGQPSQTLGRLELYGEIARGGMGAILRGRDTDLGREIAVKVLLENHQGRTELLQRFVEEARIGGQLQHPGIVPVYELGQFSEQRPYFTMKLVKGQTLARILAKRQEPTQDRPRLLKIFEQVCQTVAYAHARGVIHRDLKPSNIMVGSFAEVQVMDWGLAKVLPQTGVANEEKKRVKPQAAPVSVIRTQRGSGSDTQAGSVLGTPAYMAPEQALGEVERLDTRCDVFGLGAVLCEILTGQPPYTESEKTLALRRAVRADLAGAFARLDRCGAEAELIALAKRCLAAEPKDRPADAGVLASELTAYLESVEQRLRQAELAGAEARARAIEERKRRKLAVALAASVLVTVFVAGGGWLVLSGQKAAAEREALAKQAETEQAVSLALGKAQQLQQQASPDYS